jgi:DNA-binding transcriptional LysR family regulator
VSIADLLHEPFLALPESAGALRDYWLGTDERRGVAPRVAGVISDVDETFEAVTAGRGICFLAAGNAPIFDRGGIVMPVVTDLTPAKLVLAWHEQQQPPCLEAFVEACARVVAEGAPAPVG